MSSGRSGVTARGYTLTSGRFRLPRRAASRREDRSRFRPPRRRRVHVSPMRVDEFLSRGSIEGRGSEFFSFFFSIRREIITDYSRGRGEGGERERNFVVFFKSCRGLCRHAIPHRLFMSGFRPASLTACPPREPPPLFEQEHRNPKELTADVRKTAPLDTRSEHCQGSRRLWRFERVRVKRV